MHRITIQAQPFPKTELGEMLRQNSIAVNDYARLFFAHAGFSTEDYPPEVCVAILPLRELGLENGATLDELIVRLPALGLKLCRPATGLFLRLAWPEQPQSASSVLSGTHCAPEGSVTVLSKPLEADDHFPKGLYLRKVDGILWLRGYVCDAVYRWSADDMFAFER